MQNALCDISGELRKTGIGFRAISNDVRREVFPWFEGGGDAVMKDMLVDMAPYLFLGKLAGFLTRLSATGLANVTSGGGQVPAFRVRPRQ
jgi:hypothetical protein